MTTVPLSHRRRTSRMAAALTTAALGVTLAPALSAATAPAQAASAAPAADVPTRTVPLAEQRRVERLDIARVIRRSQPLRMPVSSDRPVAARRAPVPAADGPSLKVAPIAPTTTSARTSLTRALTSVSGTLWPGGPTANPNRQVGKLYFDKDPGAGVNWGHCTATAINSENKSTVLTAGHCVYDFTNRRWYTNTWFYPGYQYGSTLGAWSVRRMATTSNYFTNGAYADDMAIVLVNRDSAGVPLVNRVGGHGIAFNQPVNQTRTSFGYPITDSRWPGWTSDGADLYYCQGRDTYYSTGQFAGQMWLSCRMTGGASGGPWLSSVASTWMGTATSVNSNKGGVGSAWAGSMFGPYMGSQESAVFQAYRAA